jgi:hypothetical protein
MRLRSRLGSGTIVRLRLPNGAVRSARAEPAPKGDVQGRRLSAA